MVNKVILIGNVGKDPEITTIANGRRVAKFSLATSERWRDKTSGQRKEHTDWHNIVVFDEKVIEYVEKYVLKGSKLYVEGKTKTRVWEKDGVKRYTTEIVIQNFGGGITGLDKSEGGGGAYQPSEEDYGQTRDRDVGDRYEADHGFGQAREEIGADLDDEIPF